VRSTQPADCGLQSSRPCREGVVDWRHSGVDQASVIESLSLRRSGMGCRAPRCLRHVAASLEWKAGNLGQPNCDCRTNAHVVRDRWLSIPSRVAGLDTQLRCEHSGVGEVVECTSGLGQPARP
jgi:hypothetical protein